MAKYAYRDKDRKEIIYSSSATEEDRNTAFFCPNKMCEAKLYICALNGSNSAYFRATKAEFNHIKSCPFGNSNIEFDSNKYDESKFIYDNAINNLLCTTKTTSPATVSSAHGTGEPSAHPPRTLRQIYSLCKSLPVGDTYASQKIELMILDDRSEYRYPKGCFGNKIIEAIVNGKIYNDKKKEVYLAAPVNSKKYTFILSFSDETLYRKIRTETYNNRDKIIVLAGRWELSGVYNKFTLKVYGKKQVMIMKNKNKYRSLGEK